MLNIYETHRGDFAPASSLTPAEAVDLHQRGVLEAQDFGLLSGPAREAVRKAFERAVSGNGRCRVVYVHWGVRKPTRAYLARA